MAQPRRRLLHCAACLLQVHDIEGGLERAQRILQQAGGFDRVVVEQPDDLRGTALYNVYATRAAHVV